MEIDDADDRRMRATRALMDKGAQGQLGKERKAWRDRKCEKMHKWIADLEPAPNFKPFWCIICPNRTKNGRVRISRTKGMLVDLKLLTTRATRARTRTRTSRTQAGRWCRFWKWARSSSSSCYSFRMIYSVSQWNRHLSRSSGTLATHSQWSTVCLGKIAISLGRLILLLLIQNDLQCVSVKSPSL